MSRLSTQQLILQTRSHFQLQQQQTRTRQLETSLQLKLKQIQHYQQQLINLKQQTAMRVRLSEDQLTQYKKQTAEMRYSHVRELRQVNEKHQGELRKMKNSYEENLSERMGQMEKRMESMRVKYEEEVQAMRDKYENLIKMEKKQQKISKQYSEQSSSHSSQAMIKAQKEKQQHRRARRQAEQQLEAYKQAMNVLKQEYSCSLTSKDEDIAGLKGELQGLKLKIRLMEEREEQERNDHREIQNSTYVTVQQLKMTNKRQEQDLQRYKTMLEKQNQQILTQLTLKEQPTVQNESQLGCRYECQHNSLIDQLQRNLDLKQKEIQELRAVVEEWTTVIGFDRPIAERMQQISDKSLKAKQANICWADSLKSKADKAKNKRQLRY